MNKRFMTVLLASMIATTLLVGCGGKKVASIGGETIELSDEEASEIEDFQKEFNEGLTEEEQDFIAGMQDEFNEEETETTQEETELSLYDALAQITVSDEVKNSKVQDGKYQIWDFVIKSGEITIGEIKNKLAETQLENGEIPNLEKKEYCESAGWGSNTVEGEGDEMYCKEPFIEYSVSYRKRISYDNSETLKFVFVGMQDPNKTNENGASYVNDYVFVMLGQKNDELGSWTCISELMNGEEIYSMTQDEVVAELEAKGYLVVNEISVLEGSLVPLDNSILCPNVSMEEGWNNFYVSLNCIYENYKAYGIKYELTINEMNNTIDSIKR